MKHAADVMQSGVVSVSPELRVAELEAFLSAEQIGGAPVVDTNGKLLGVVSQTDIIRALSEEPSVDLQALLAPDLRVEEIMTRDVVTVSADDDVRHIARAMLNAGVHRALVTDEDGVSGIITTFDLLRLLT